MNREPAARPGGVAFRDTDSEIGYSGGGKDIVRRRRDEPEQGQR
jgi:hypothetical protein